MQVSDITIVTVAFSSVAVIGDMLQSVPRGVQVVIVDNGPDDGTRGLAEAVGARVIVPAGGNIGFGSACNLGAAGATTAFVLFLNPDAVLQPGTLERLLQAADEHPQAAALGPAIERTDGRLAVKRRSRLEPDAPEPPRKLPETSFEVSFLSGAALLVRKSAFDAVGGFDTNIFLYHEDDDLTLRLRRDAGPLILVPAARIRHQHGRSSPRSPAMARLKAYHMARSHVYTMAKHGAPRPFASALVRALKALVSPTMLSRRKRAQAMGALRGVLSTRTDGGAGPGSLQMRQAGSLIVRR